MCRLSSPRPRVAGLLRRRIVIIQLRDRRRFATFNVSRSREHSIKLIHCNVTARHKARSQERDRNFLSFVSFAVFLSVPRHAVYGRRNGSLSSVSTINPAAGNQHNQTIATVSVSQLSAVVYSHRHQQFRAPARNPETVHLPLLVLIRGTFCLLIYAIHFCRYIFKRNC